MRLLKNVNCTGVSARELHRLGDDRGQHGLKIERRVDRLGDLAERAEFFDRARELGGAAPSIRG